MACTQRNRYLYLFKQVMLINPGHGKIFVIGIGIIKQEWDWCQSILKEIRYSTDTESFKKKCLLLIKYLRYKFVQKSAPKHYVYPVNQYLMSSTVPDKEFYFYFVMEVKTIYFYRNPVK